MNCKNCKYFNGKYCDEIGEKDDENYPHNNHKMIGLEIYVSDDSGLDIKVRVSENFGCILYKHKG